MSRTHGGGARLCIGLLGVGDGFQLLKQIPEMLLVSVLEASLIRGLVFRMAEGGGAMRC